MPPLRQHLRLLLLAPALAYLSWLGMMATHEAGHVLGTLLTGGKVATVKLPLVGFSQTLVEATPHPLAEVWAGPVGGCLLPVALWAALQASKVRGWPLARFFAGFCLIANGGYIGTGPLLASGDTFDMAYLGTPPWVMVAFGLAAGASGLALWNRLGTRFGLGMVTEPLAWSTVAAVWVGLALAIVAIIALGL